jgi:ribosomal protein S27E
MPTKKPAKKTKNPNTGFLQGMSCPDCGSFGPFYIASEIMLKVYDDEQIEYSSPNWGENYVSCVKCGSVGNMARFSNKDK